MQLFGILNLTPDSFSDGNLFIQEKAAIAHAQELAKKCVAVDVGPQSTRPNALIISPEEEIARLGNSIAQISAFTKTSIDSFNFQTQKFALSQGASYINDVSAFQRNFKNTEIFKISPPNVKFIFMHHLTVPANKQVVMQTQKQEMINEITAWAKQKIEEYCAFGIAKNRLIFDVGIGFGKNAHQNLYIVENIEKFLPLTTELGVEIMLGHSRKSFMEILKPNASIEEKDLITQQITAQAARKGIHFARVHKP